MENEQDNRIVVPTASSRRRFIGVAGAASIALAAPAIVRAQAKKPMKVSIGRQPWAAGNSPVTAYMMANKTFERYAAEAGYDLTVDYRVKEGPAQNLWVREPQINAP